jgi:hypothetical protein
MCDCEGKGKKRYSRDEEMQKRAGYLFFISEKKNG